MPRRKLAKKLRRSKRSRKLARGKRSTSFRRRRRYVRRLYRRRGRKIRARTSRAFRQRAKVGIKYSLNLSLNEFLLLPFYDLSFLPSQLAPNGPYPIFAMNGGQTHGFDHMNGDWITPLREFFGGIGTAFSTAAMSLTNAAFEQGTYQAYRRNMRAFAFNPPLSPIILGNMFSEYINKYEKFKYVGCRVKWIPAKSTFNSSQPFTRFVGQNQLHFPISDFVAQYNQQQLIGYRLPAFTANQTFASNLEVATNMDEPPEEDFLASPAINDNMAIRCNKLSHVVAQPQYRLWVNFDKYPFCTIDARLNWGYIDNEADWNQLFNTLPANRGSRPYADFNQYNMNTRFKYRSVFDCSGEDHMSLLLSRSSTRSYSLLRPFKFFVRPYSQISYKENAEGAPAFRDINVDITNRIKAYTVPGGDDLVSASKRYGYQLMPHFYPEAYFMPYHPDWGVTNYVQTIDDQMTKMIMNMNDSNFINPVLFSYFLTRDDLAMGQYEPVIAVKTKLYNNATEADRAHMYQQYRWAGHPNTEAIGRFKVTFYVRFKNLRNQSVFVTPQHDTPAGGLPQDSTYPVNYDNEVANYKNDNN